MEKLSPKHPSFSDKTPEISISDLFGNLRQKTRALLLPAESEQDTKELVPEKATLPEKVSTPTNEQEPICLEHLLGKLEQPGAKLIKEIVWRDYLRLVKNLEKTRVLHGLCDSHNLPTLFEVLLSILHQITPEQMEFIQDKKFIRDPGLIVKPNIPLKYLVDTLDEPLSSKRQSQRHPLNLTFNRKAEIIFKLLDEHHKINDAPNWQISIGEKYMYTNCQDKFDYSSLEDKRDRFLDTFSQIGVKPMGLNSYIQVLHDSLLQDITLDSGTVTFLADEPRLFDAFICARFNRDHIDIRHYGPSEKDPYTQIRPEIIFDILENHPYQRLLKAIGNFPYFKYTSL